ncbi:MAG: hypothetical protein WCR24_07105 [Candidatus Methanomethylophilaceae archaeon]
MRSDSNLFKLLLIFSISASALIGTVALTEEADAAGTEMFDPSDKDVSGYIRVTGQLGGIGGPSDNKLATVAIEPDTSYNVSFTADVRFRVGTLNSSDLATGFYLTNYHVSPKDSNGSSVIGSESCTITSGTGHDLMLIFYWSSAGTASSSDVRGTISVVPTITFSSDVYEATIIVGDEWSYSPEMSEEDASIAATGADWISATDGTVSGTADRSGDFEIAVTAGKAGYDDGTQTITVHAIDRLVFVSVPTDGVISLE